MLSLMPVRTRVLSQARVEARKLRAAIGAAAREARLASGLRLIDVGHAIDRSASWVSRVERGLGAEVRIDEVVLLCAAVGLRFWSKTYPAARAIRDAPQLELLRRFRARLSAPWKWQYEVIVPIVGDQRAADAVIRLRGVSVMIEAFTRLADAQAQFRAILLKARDLGLERVVIVVAETHANRAALALARDVLASDFPLTTRSVLAALGAGRDPGANGIVMI
jgi:transcriptional regulator with XRE-family HTH domain